MCCSIDNLLECCTVQLEMQGKKDVLISCLYRTTGSNLDDFNNKLESLLNTCKTNNKIQYICGDFNVNILNSTEHKKN